MFTFFYLFAALFLLVVLLGIAYRGSGDVAEEPLEPDRQLDRLAMLLDPEVMEEIIQLARAEGCSEVQVLNHLLRKGLENPSRP